MADIPVQRSYEQILSDIVDSFIARTGISSLKVGSPLLSMMEAVAQSQFRNTADGFRLLSSSSLDYAVGDALTQIAADEGLTRRNAASSFGYVTFTDTGYTKISTFLKLQTTAGSKSVTVTGVTGFVPTKQVRIGSDTYTISAVNGDTITFASALSKLYPVGTEVVQLSGSGDKTIPAGTSVGTGTLNFVTTNTATILDGEVSVANVSVVCSTTGTSTNVPAKSINQINSTLSFTASVVNPLGFVNGEDQETDDELRDRVRAARRDKQRGTAASIENAVIGAFAADESKRVVSSNLVDTGTGKATLYIDDGTGYEGITSPIGIETLTASAVGGEKYFELQGGRPVAQCFVESGLTFPADLRQGGSITVSVGSGSSTVVIPPTAFVDAQRATSLELASFINGQIGLTFAAATRSNYTKLILYPKNQSDNTITVTNQLEELGFAVGYPVQTLYLFKNGVLLTEGEGQGYVLNRNKGQIYLSVELSKGDVLTAGSVDSRVYISTKEMSSSGSLSSQVFWLVPDAPVTQTAIFQPSDIITHSYGAGVVTIGNADGKFDDVRVGDWIVMWDSALNHVWTKRVESLGTLSVVFEAQSGLSPAGPITLNEGGIRVFRTSGVPQKVEPTTTYASLAELAVSINSKVHGMHVAAGVDKILFYTDSFRDDGAIAYITGTPTVTDLFGFSKTEVTQKSNPVNYQPSLVSGNADISFFGTEVQILATPSTTIPDIGGVSLFTTGEQKGFKTTQLSSSAYRATLNSEGFIATDLRRLSPGFHLSDTDTISIKVDESNSKVFTFPMSIDAKIIGTAVTTQDSNPLPYTQGGYSLNDWAVWSASSQQAIPYTGQLDNITFTSKKYGYSNPIRKVQYAYPTVADQSSVRYKIKSGTMYVTLPSGPTITVSGVSANQRLWLGNYSSGSKTMDVVCTFDGLSYYNAVPYQTTVQVQESSYPNLNLVPSAGDYLFIKRTDTDADVGNFQVISTSPAVGGWITIVLSNPAGNILVPDGTTVSFSISSAQASSIASFAGVTSNSYMYDNSEDITYRVVSAATKKLTFASDNLFVVRWFGSRLTFFNSKNDQATTLDNEYFTSSSPSQVVVTRSTPEIFSFAVPSDEGDVSVSNSVNYTRSVVDGVFTGKITQSFNGLVRFVPVTAENVKDCISYNMKNLGVSCFANVAGELELVRTESGVDSSVQVAATSANTYSATVTEIATSACRVVTDGTSPFVAGHSVKLTDGVSEEIFVIESVIAYAKNVNTITFSTSVAETYTLANTKLVALGKLDFSTDALATNSDGYKYYAGLIGEANRIVYGDAADPANYGGYASANANIEVVGPQVKQIQMSIYVKMSGGFTVTDAKAAVRNAASAVVNSTPVGQSVAYSDVVAAVNAIPGVFSVAIASFSTENPTIPVLAFEKPLIIDLEKDIYVEIAGI